MNIIAIIILLIFVSVAVIVVSVVVINTILPSTNTPSSTTNTDYTKPTPTSTPTPTPSTNTPSSTTNTDYTKPTPTPTPSSKCLTGVFAVVDMYPPTVEILEKIIWTKGKAVNDINECKNNCDKYEGCKSYVYHSNDKLCWLGSNSTFETGKPPYNQYYTSCLK